MKAREKINALVARQHALETRDKTKRPTYTFPK